MLNLLRKLYYSLSYRFANIICKLCPIKHGAIVVDSFNGRGWGDSAKYVALEIHKRNLPYKIYWLCKDMGCEMPSWITKVPYDTLKCKLSVAQASIILSNVKHGYPYTKKRDQYYIQLWHGDFGPKFCEKDSEDVLPDWYVRLSKEDSLITDAITSGSRFFSEVARNAFYYPQTTKIIECGVPRNDIFFGITEKKKDALRKKYGIAQGKRIVLYAPTFRDDGSTDIYNLDVNLILEKLGENWVIVIRLHPNIKDKTSLFKYDDRVINGTDFPEAQELCVLSDVLISDYSSISTDFILMRKPFFLYTPDIEKYKGSRGLRPVFYKMPYYQDNKSLAKAIEEFDAEKYAQWLQEFVDKEIGSYDDGNASKRLVNYIENIMKGKK